ncbi:MAG: cupin domain-containing protein [Burkholderiales bacterium]
MAEGLQPIRRVVTGNDGSGRSRIVWDGPAPNAHPNPNGPSGHTDLWVWHQTPPPLDGEDAGFMHYDFPSSPEGGHVRVIEAKGKPADYDPARDPLRIEPHSPKERPAGCAWDRGGKSQWSSDMHKTQTIDYAVCIEGMRLLVLDDTEVELKAGDVVVQVGAWHQWKQPRSGRMVFDMFSADFPDGPAGVAQGNDPVLRPPANRALPPGLKASRRVVTIDRKAGEGNVVSDDASPDVRTDPARPGFACARMWVTDGTPAKIVYETLQLPNVLQPPRRGSVFNVFTFPPDESWRGRVGRAEVDAFYRAMGAPGVSTHSPEAPHPYMQKMRTLDFCVVVEGEIVLVLDTQEAVMRAGDVVIQRGTNHAWSNRSGKPAVVSIASHDAS